MVLTREERIKRLKKAVQERKKRNAPNILKKRKKSRTTRLA